MIQEKPKDKLKFNKKLKLDDFIQKIIIKKAPYQSGVQM